MSQGIRLFAGGDDNSIEQLAMLAVARIRDVGVAAEIVALLDNATVALSRRTPLRGEVARQRLRTLRDSATPYVLVDLESQSNQVVIELSTSREPVVASSKREAAALIANFALRSSSIGPPPWDRSTEELLRRLSLLLEQNSALVAAFVDVTNDLRTAQAQVAVLEAELEALRALRNDVGFEWRSPQTFLAIAMIVATLLAPVVGVLTGGLGSDVDESHSVAVRVQQECNAAIVNIDGQVFVKPSGLPGTD